MYILVLYLFLLDKHPCYRLSMINSSLVGNLAGVLCSSSTYMFGSVGNRLIMLLK